MAEDGDDCRPGSMTFMGSPIDARLSPTVTNKLAEGAALHLVPVAHDRQPSRRPIRGLGRRVYPGFVQLASFHVDERREA